MRAGDFITSRTSALWFFATAVLAGGCDLSTKGWAEQTLSSAPGQSITVIDPWLQFSLAYNRGTAFSLIRNLGETRWLFGGIAVAVALMLLAFAIRQKSTRLWPVLALGLTAGGAIGNGYDRVFRVTPAGDTGVVDFIRVNLSSTLSWPTFNLADVWIFVGIVAMMWLWWRRPPAWTESEEPTPAGQPA